MHSGTQWKQLHVTCQSHEGWQRWDCVSMRVKGPMQVCPWILPLLSHWSDGLTMLHASSSLAKLQHWTPCRVVLLACLSGLPYDKEESSAIPTAALPAPAGTDHSMSAPLRQRPATPSRTVSAALEPFFIRLQYLQVSHRALPEQIFHQQP